MKTCPVCNARLFDDMEICYGCMHRFSGEETPEIIRATEMSSKSAGDNTGGTGVCNNVSISSDDCVSSDTGVGNGVNAGSDVSISSDANVDNDISTCNDTNVSNGANVVNRASANIPFACEIVIKLPFVLEQAETMRFAASPQTAQQTIQQATQPPTQQTVSQLAQQAMSKSTQQTTPPTMSQTSSQITKQSIGLPDHKGKVICFC